MHVGRLGRREDRLGVGLWLEAGDVLGDGAGEQLDVLRQIADVLARALPDPTARRRRRRGGPCRASASRRRRAARASEDLPEALGPMMPSPLPALSEKATSCTTKRWTPGGVALTPSTEKVALGRGSAIGASPRRAAPPRARSRRFQLWRAATKPRQLAIASSTGASAREVRIELAMMMPAVACCSITR